jgi:tetratricopeptide (TPR) repeat protein
MIRCELARLLRDERPAEALALARSAVDELDDWLRSHPPQADCLHGLAAAIDRLAVVEDHLNRPEEALRDFRRAADLYQSFLHDRPFNIKYRSGLATVLHQIGRILVETGRPAEALEPYRKAVELREALLSLTPENVHRISDCAGTWYRLGEAREELGQFDDAVEAYQMCLVHQRGVCTRAPGEAAHRSSLDERLRHTEWLLFRLGRWDEAAKLARERQALRPGDLGIVLSAALLRAAALLVRQHELVPLALRAAGSPATAASVVSNEPVSRAAARGPVNGSTSGESGPHGRIPSSSSFR